MPSAQRRTDSHKATFAQLLLPVLCARLAQYISNILYFLYYFNKEDHKQDQRGLQAKDSPYQVLL